MEIGSVLHVRTRVCCGGQLMFTSKFSFVASTFTLMCQMVFAENDDDRVLPCINFISYPLSQSQKSDITE